MASLNRVHLIGNLGRDSEFRHTPAGQAVCNFSIATTDKYKDQERTEWHNIVVWGKLAEIAGKHLKKGQSVFVEGRIQSKKWVDNNGNDRFATEIICERFQMFGGRQSGGSNDNSGSPDDGIPF